MFRAPEGVQDNSPEGVQDNRASEGAQGDTRAEGTPGLRGRPGWGDASERTPLRGFWTTPVIS